MTRYQLANQYTEAFVTTKVYTEVEPADKDNPATIVKTYSKGVLTRLVSYDSESEVTSDWSYVGTRSHSRMTDSVSGVNRKPKNIATFLGVEYTD